MTDLEKIKDCCTKLCQKNKCVKLCYKNRKTTFHGCDRFIVPVLWIIIKKIEPCVCSDWSKTYVLSEYTT